MNDHNSKQISMASPEQPGAVNRRILVGGTIAAGLATAGYLRLAGAQAEPGTPEAEVTDDTSATPNASVSTEDTSPAASVLDHAQAVLAAVQADRDAAASQIDTATVDEVLSQASSLLDDAVSAVNGGDAEGAMHAGAGAIQTAHAARDLVIAQLTYPGLPSQHVPASRVLARAHEQIATIDGEDAAVGFYATTAQGVYQTAYEQYDDGAYAQALANGKAIVALTGAAAILSGSGGLGMPGMFDDGGFGHGGRNRGPQLSVELIPMPDDDEPETVPAPDF